MGLRGLLMVLSACGARFDHSEDVGGQAAVGGAGGGTGDGGAGSGGEDRRCHALRFDGVDDRVIVPDDGTLDQFGAITVEAWISFDTHANEMHIVSNHHHDARRGYALLIYGADDGGVHHLNWRYQTGDNAAFVGFAAIVPKKWHHVAGTYDGDRFRLFLNGQAVTDEDATDGLQIEPYDGPLTIGNAHYNPVFPFKGLIDEVRLSKVARYGDGTDPPASFEVDDDTVALWRFEEGVASQEVLDAAGAHPGVLGETSASEATDPSRVEVPCR